MSTISVMRARIAFALASRKRTVSLLLGSPILYSLHSNHNIQHNDSNSETRLSPGQSVVIGERYGVVAKQDSTSHETKHQTPEPSKPQPPGADAKEDLPPIKDEDVTAWASFSAKCDSAFSSISSIKWSSIGDSITDYIVPQWFQVLPGYVAKLQREMEMAPGSLGDEIWQEAQDPDINPEITSLARVRIGKGLCADEKEFVKRRKRYTAEAFAKYLDIPENDVDPRDVPTIAMCGSGGGLRALVAGASSYLCAQEAGLFDCVTYTAGVSGSCWLQTLYYSTLGGQRHDKLMEHLKSRIGVHIAFPPEALRLLTTAPTNKFLLSGIIEKLKGDPNADYGLVDLYGILLAARLLVPRGELGVNTHDLKLSNQRSYLSKGAQPLPIYTAVRHEIPLEEVESEHEKSPGVAASSATKEKAKQEAWFQWFEFTPYELWCEDFDAGIPSWSIGRHFQKGVSVADENGVGLPELRIPFLMGIWGSAFCATLSHYYKEIRPVVKSLVGFGGIDGLIEDKNEDLIKVHPIDPAAVPNFVLGLEDQLPPTCPKSVFSADHLALMDSGMSNNLPIYPLLRADRDIDIIVVFDASADIKTENWLSVAAGYARQRGIKGWPIGAGWPKEDTTEEETRKDLDASQEVNAQEAAGKIAEARETQRQVGNSTQEIVDDGKHRDSNTAELGYCNVWVGTTLERKFSSSSSASSSPPTPSKQRPLSPSPASTDWTSPLLSPDAGIALVYFPFLPNAKVQGVDPNTTPFMSTWNFVYTPEDIDQVVALARANFEEGKEQTRRTVRAVYERKKARRLAGEGRERERMWRRRVREGADHFL